MASKRLPLELCWIKFGGERKKNGGKCDAPNSALGVKQGCHFFFPVYYKLINFQFVHLYNIKHLTCIIFCSSGLQNIYKLHMWKCSTFTIFTLLTKETKIHIH